MKTGAGSFAIAEGLYFEGGHRFGRIVKCRSRTDRKRTQLIYKVGQNHYSAPNVETSVTLPSHAVIFNLQSQMCLDESWLEHYVLEMSVDLLTDAVCLCKKSDREETENCFGENSLR